MTSEITRKKEKNPRRSGMWRGQIGGTKYTPIEIPRKKGETKKSKTFPIGLKRTAANGERKKAKGGIALKGVPMNHASKDVRGNSDGSPAHRKRHHQIREGGGGREEKKGQNNQHGG